MKKHELQVFIIALLAITYSINAQYWFQFGTTGGSESYYNTGAAATIVTVSQPGISNGSMGFWVGENLNNGAFLQTGYVIENQSGDYPTYCTASACSNYTYLKKGDAAWFYEYFSPNSNSGSFLGEIGPDGSAGINGTPNRYSFHSSGNKWYFLFNGNTIGSINLGTSSSGTNAPVAFGELANTTSSSIQINPVAFSNLSFDDSLGTQMPVSHGYSYIGYGIGSEKALQNPYGVSEIASRVNYFEVGSGLPRPSNGYELWNIGYHLRVVSEYGTRSTNISYQAYYTPTISEPKYVYINGTARAEFTGWSGSGTGSYTGGVNQTQVTMSSNITEYAKWQLQYLVSINSDYGESSGTGWYNPGSTAYYSINESLFYLNKTTRYLFAGWSNGNNETEGSATVAGPMPINAIWYKEYYISAYSEYGNLTGTGWYRNGSPAKISINDYVINKSRSMRTAFYAWDNGSASPYLNFKVSKPVNISAVFKNQYLAYFESLDEYGNRVFPQKIYVEGSKSNGTAFLFSGKNYTITGAYYDGLLMQLNQTVSVRKPGTIFLSLPLYKVNITATDIFGIPVNAPMTITFANGTSESTSPGPSGRLSFAEVPYGNLSASAVYDGVTQQSTISDGGTLRIIFVSIYDIAAFASIVALAFIIYGMSRKKLSK